MRRLAAHIIVTAALVGTAIQIDPVPSVAAAPDPKPTPAPRLIAYTEPATLPRATVTDRGSTPLPQPVPVDPNATPLPAPTFAQPVQTAPSPQVLWPVAGTITTYYSAAHPAVDIAAPCGTPVVAPMSGQITFAAWRANGGGYVLEIASDVGLWSLNHLNGFALVGGWVEAGTVVAYVGTTGNSRGCHLHLGLLVDGTWRNPLAWL